MQPKSYYDRSGHPWTEEEDSQLENEYTIDNLTIIQIGDIHKRTPGGITWQLKRLKLLNNNVEARGYQEYRDSPLYKEIINTAKQVKPSVDPLKISVSEREEEHERAGAPWSTEECEQLIDEYKNKGLSVQEISKIHKRNMTGVASRLRKLNIVESRVAVKGYLEYKQSDLYKAVCQARYERKVARNTIIEPHGTVKASAQLSMIDRNDINNLRQEIADLKMAMAELTSMLAAVHDKGRKPIQKHNLVNT